jgi:hypothetical protein
LVKLNSGILKNVREIKQIIRNYWKTILEVSANCSGARKYVAESPTLGLTFIHSSIELREQIELGADISHAPPPWL